MYRVDFSSLHYQGGNVDKVTAIVRDGDKHVHISFSAKELQEALAKIPKPPKD